MAKKIKVTEERFCCQHNDLLPYEGIKLPDFSGSVVFCRHCGQQHATRGFVDAAGSRDWEYVPVVVLQWKHRGEI